MEKNYYDILGLDAYEDCQDVISARYRERTARLRARVSDKGVKERLIELNEAFLTLSDPEVKKRYDSALRFKFADDELSRAVSAKRERAARFVSGEWGRLSRKKRKKITASAVICGFLIAASCLATCSKIITALTDGARTA